MTRAEHLEWAKERAKRELWREDLSEYDAIANACSSIASDLNKHPETENHSACMVMFMQILNGTMLNRESADRFIEGFA